MDLTQSQGLVAMRMNHVLRIMEPLDLQGGDWDQRLNQLPLANDLVQTM